MKRRVFVAGASGVIGRALCRQLVEDGWSVFGTSRYEEKRQMLLDMGVEPVIVDVFDKPLLLDVVTEARPEVVIHQLTDLPPGLDPARMGEALVRTARIREIGTRNLVVAATAAGVHRMVAQSIAFAYAPGPTPHDEDAQLNVDDPDFAFSARALVSLERQVLEAPFEGLVLRYGKLYGPGTGSDEPPPGGPVHVDAAADAARLAATRGGRGIYNVAEDDGAVSSKKAIEVLGWTPVASKPRSSERPAG